MGQSVARLMVVSLIPARFQCTFMEIDNEIFSTAILLLPLIQEVLESVQASKIPLVRSSDCRASENLDDFQSKLTFSPYMPIHFVMQCECLF